MTDRPMDVKLNEAVERRIKREGEFIDEIISQINLAIESLDECDPSNARTAIDLTKEQLSEIIFKLNDVTNMTDRTASIANIVKDHQLMRRPNALPLSAVPSPPPSALPMPLPPPSSVPMPPPAPTLPMTSPKTPLGPIVNPGAVPSNGRNQGLTPGRRGGKRTRRFRKK